MRSIRNKILSASRLELKLKRARPRRVVFTNGCFDILHPGHVRYLERARALGDCLIVALNSDESVRSIKGPARPINRLKDRAQVMAALESVDYVTWFTTSTPLKLIERLKPNVLAKGGDWPVSKIVGADVVIARGGRAVSIPFVAGHSTTSVLSKITG